MVQDSVFQIIAAVVGIVGGTVMGVEVVLFYIRRSRLTLEETERIEKELPDPLSTLLQASQTYLQELEAAKPALSQLLDKPEYQADRDLAEAVLVLLSFLDAAGKRTEWGTPAAILMQTESLIGKG